MKNILKKISKARTTQVLLTLPLALSMLPTEAANAQSAKDIERYKISICNFSPTLTNGGAPTFTSYASARSDSAEFVRNSLSHFQGSLANLQYPDEAPADSKIPASLAAGANFDIKDYLKTKSPLFNAGAKQGMVIWDFMKVYLQKLGNQVTSGSFAITMGPSELCTQLGSEKIAEAKEYQERLFRTNNPNSEPLEYNMLITVPPASNQQTAPGLSLQTKESSDAALKEILNKSDLISTVLKANVLKGFVTLSGDIAIRLPLGLSLDLGPQKQSIMGGKGELNRLFVSKKPHSSNTNRFVLIKLTGFKFPLHPPSTWDASFFKEWSKQRPAVELFFGDNLRYVQQGEMARLDVKSFGTRVIQTSPNTKEVISDKLSSSQLAFWTTPIDELWRAARADGSRLDGTINLGGKWTLGGITSIQELMNKFLNKYNLTTDILPLKLNIDHLKINFEPLNVETEPLSQLGRSARITLLAPTVVNPSLKTQGLTGLYFELPPYFSTIAASDDFFLSLLGTKYHVFKADEHSPLHIPIPAEATAPSIEAQNEKLKGQAQNWINLLYTSFDNSVSAAIDSNLDCSKLSTDQEWDKCLEQQAAKIGFNPNLH
jgi:hypothetical protein